jgi:hypothetical protein
MSHRAVCTICSKEKRKDKGLLPARQRYTGSHISKVVEIAKKLSLPVFILSGKYGFIQAETKISYYDHQVSEDDVETLSFKVGSQIQNNGVEELNFYAKIKPTWLPYRNVLSRATKGLGIRLQIIELSEED